MYRKAALDKLSSPEKLDLLMKVINPRGWLFLLAFALAITAFLLWGFMGSIKTQVQGSGLLVGDGVHDVVPLATGQILSISVHPGDEVKAGAVIATISQFALEQEIEEAKSRHEEFKYEYAKAKSFGSKDIRLQSDFINKQRSNLRQTIALSDRYLKDLEQQVETDKALFSKGLITRKQLSTKEKEKDEEALRIKGMKADIRELSAQKHSVGFDFEQRLLAAEQRINENERLIGQLESRLEKYASVRSAYDGKVIESLADVGDVVEAGVPLVKIGRIHSGEKKLRMLMYISAEDGKKVQKGMEVFVVPATVKAEEYGYMIGNVTYVSEYPATRKGMMKALKNAQLVDQLSKSGAPFEIYAEFEKDPSTVSGFVWTSGSGPPHGIFEGTPCQGRITIETQKPVTLVVPALKTILGSE